MTKLFHNLNRIQSHLIHTVPLASVPLSGILHYNCPSEFFGFPPTFRCSLPHHVPLLRLDGLAYFRTMLYNRTGEKIASEAYQRHIIRGFMHVSTGLEASCVGTVAALRPFQDDRVLTGYRNHGWAHAMGIPWVEILCELLGKRTGCSSSKGGSLHLYSNTYSSGGLNPSSPLSIGTGMALAKKLSGSVVVTVVDQDAISSGSALEAFHLAQLLKVPIIYLIENTFPGRCLSRGYGIPGLRVDGFNILMVREGAKFAIEYAASNGPVILEVNCYSEIFRDPIEEFRVLLKRYDLVSDEEFEKVTGQVIDAARMDLELSIIEIPPSTNELFNDVYADYLNTPVRGKTSYVRVYGKPSQRIRLTPIQKTIEEEEFQPNEM